MFRDSCKNDSIMRTDKLTAVQLPSEDMKERKKRHFARM